MRRLTPQRSSVRGCHGYQDDPDFPDRPFGLFRVADRYELPSAPHCARTVGRPCHGRCGDRHHYGRHDGACHGRCHLGRCLCPARYDFRNHSGRVACHAGRRGCFGGPDPGHSHRNDRPGAQYGPGPAGHAAAGAPYRQKRRGRRHQGHHAQHAHRRLRAELVRPADHSPGILLWRRCRRQPAQHHPRFRSDRHGCRRRLLARTRLRDAGADDYEQNSGSVLLRWLLPRRLLWH